MASQRDSVLVDYIFSQDSAKLSWTTRHTGPYHGGSRVWLTRTEQGREAERSEVRIGEP